MARSKIRAQRYKLTAEFVLSDRSMYLYYRMEFEDFFKRLVAKRADIQPDYLAIEKVVDAGEEIKSNG